jgi:integrase/recombinase XerD
MTSHRAWLVVSSRLEAEGLVPATIASKERLWRIFDRWLSAEKGPSFDLRRITVRDASGFLSYLDHGRLRPIGAAYSPHVKASCFDLARRAFDILVDEGRLLRNPWARVSVARARSKPRRIPTVNEVAHLLDSITPGSSGQGMSPVRNMRDRALFELLYASGMRPKEAGCLLWSDIDLEKRMVHVRSTKVKRDRVVPLTKSAATWLSSWKRVSQTKSRGSYAFGHDRGLSSSYITKRLKFWSNRAGFEKLPTAYSLRHACASHLLDAGADLRYVQALLGHESLETTVVYTQQAEEQLKRYYKSFHPRENLLFAEVDEEYRMHWEKLCEELRRAQKQRVKRLRKAASTSATKTH